MNELTPILLEPAPFSLFSHRDRRAERLPLRTVLFAARVRAGFVTTSIFSLPPRVFREEMAGT